MTRTNFLHIDLHAQKDGRATFVIDELARVPGSCAHVQEPSPPIQLAGIPYEGISAELAARLAVACETTKRGVKKPIRITQRILLAGVASYPLPMADMRVSPDERRRYSEWRMRAVAFFLDHAAKHDALCSIVAHHDEKFPHIHAACIPKDAAILARELHPGYAAREAETQKSLRQGMPKREAAAAGWRAYAPAMRAFQDSYHEQVGRPSGHARLLTGRARLPRNEYLAVRACHDARDQAIVEREQAEQDRARIAAETARLVKIGRRASEDATSTAFSAGTRALLDGRIADIAYNPVDGTADLVPSPHVDDVAWAQLLADLEAGWDHGLLTALEALVAIRPKVAHARQAAVYA